jgi:uncharacterized protein YcfJ
MSSHASGEWEIQVAKVGLTPVVAAYKGRHQQTTRSTMAWSATGASHDGRKPMTDDAAGAHETTEREHLSNHPGTGDEQVKGAVAGGVGGAVVGAIVGGPVGAVVGGAIGATSGAAAGAGAEAVDEKSKHDEVVAEHEARRP